MKKIKFLMCAFAATMVSLTFNACSDDDPVIPEKPIEPEKPVEPEKPAPLTTHFDIWVTVGATGGMGATDAVLVKSVDSLGVQPKIDFKNDGVDVTATIKEETIYKGKYYYQVPVSEDRFGKYQIVGNKLNVIAEQKFDKNTYSARKYTHAWIDDNTLLIMAANGSKKKIIWTKLNTDNMSILSEGELDLDIPEDSKFSTSGLATYRKSDKKIIYLFQRKPKDKKAKKCFYAAFINVDDMKVEKEAMEDRAEQMEGTAYGELLQDKMFFDENEDLYVACGSVIPGASSSTQRFGRLIRIKKGEMDFDKSYEGYKYDSGKIITASFLAPGKALLYIMDPSHTGAADWGADFNCYYAVLDLMTDKKTELEYEGKHLPYNSGNFSQRSYVDGDIAYVGTNPADSEPTIYIYDIKSGKTTKGLSIVEGYGFDRIVKMDNADAE